MAAVDIEQTKGCSTLASTDFVAKDVAAQTQLKAPAARNPDTMKCFYRPQKDMPLFLWHLVPPANQNFLTSTVMLVKVQFVTFALVVHAPLRSSLDGHKEHERPRGGGNPSVPDANYPPN